MAGKRTVLLGETHDRYDIHRWQLHVAASLLATGRPLVMGFEMFPRRVQPALDAWIAGDLDAAAFLEQSEWATVWGFTPELYLPLFHFCRQFRVPMKALNCRHPLVTEVGKLGWDAIAEADRDGLTPSKSATLAYRQYLFDITGGGSPARKATSAASHPAAAQAEKSAALPDGASQMQESHGDWTVSCRVAEARKSCMILQALGRSTGETVLSLELVPLTETQAEGILLSPFGLKLADGVKLAVDGKPFASPFPFMTCVEVGCIVPVTLKAEELARLKGGKEMIVSAANASSGAAIDLKLSLTGFKTAFDRARELLAAGN